MRRRSLGGTGVASPGRRLARRRRRRGLRPRSHGRCGTCRREGPSRAAGRRRCPSRRRRTRLLRARVEQVEAGDDGPRRCWVGQRPRWPTIGAMLLSNARMNAQLRSCVVGVEDGGGVKRSMVSMLPSCRKPKPRTWRPLWALSCSRGTHRRHAEHADLLPRCAGPSSSAARSRRSSARRCRRSPRGLSTWQPLHRRRVGDRAEVEIVAGCWSD